MGMRRRRAVPKRIRGRGANARTGGRRDVGPNKAEGRAREGPPRTALSRESRFLLHSGRHLYFAASLIGPPVSMGASPLLIVSTVTTPFSVLGRRARCAAAGLVAPG